LKPIPVDFETEAIKDMPRTYPKPCGLAIEMPGKPALYLAWGHPTDNGAWQLDRKGKPVPAKGIKDVERAARLMLADGYKHPGGVLGHNVCKFDLPVAEAHWGLKPPAWDRVHDTMFTLFLRDPHATGLHLKPAAERWLGEAPAERDAVYDWLADNGIIAKPRMVKGVLTYPKEAGAFISKAPGSLVAPYAIGDLTRAEGLQNLHMPWIKKMKMMEPYDRERELAPILLDNERQGICIDVPQLKRDLPIYEAALVKADTWIRKKLHTPGLNVDSDEDVADALRSAGVVKDFPKTPTGLDSISKKNLTVEFFSDKRVWQALYYRNALATVLSMSMRKWLAEAQETGGRIYRSWNQVRQGSSGNGVKGARSGRITVSDLQNISKDFTDRGDGYEHPAFLKVPELPLVRKYVIADAGETFGHSDVDQQELKIVAHYEDGALAKAYRDDPKTDIHTFVQKLIERVTGKHYDRRPVKIVDFRTVYGGGKQGLAEHLHIPYSEASDLIDDWKAALPDVVALDKGLKKIFAEGDFIRTLGGRVYFVKPPAVAKKGPRKGQLITFDYTALNYLVQPSAADQTKQAIINYAKHPKRKARMLAAVHDEINVSLPKGREMEQLKVLRECMVGAFTLDVPVTTTLKMGRSWGDLKKVEE
jgi:DNA polymerase I-like protein with 3'-5' exonuclease and polymerase domains